MPDAMSSPSRSPAAPRCSIPHAWTVPAACTTATPIRSEHSGDGRPRPGWAPPASTRCSASSRCDPVGKPLGGLGDRAVDPAHQAAQLLAGDLDGVLGVFLAQLLQLLVAALDVGDQLFGEVAI